MPWLTEVKLTGNLVDVFFCLHGFSFFFHVVEIILWVEFFNLFLPFFRYVYIMLVAVLTFYI